MLPTITSQKKANYKPLLIITSEPRKADEQCMRKIFQTLVIVLYSLLEKHSVG